MTTLIDIVTAASIATDVSIEEIVTAQRPTGPHAAMVRQQVMWIAASIYNIEIWEIAALMHRPKRAIQSGVDHIDFLHESSDRIRKQVAAIILAIDRLEVDAIRHEVRKYRDRGATIPSIARFVGVPKETVALILGIPWGKEHEKMVGRG